jgi:hypothetical protein
MKPKQYPYSGKLKASTMNIVKAFDKACSAYRVKGQKSQEKAEQELDKATQRLYQLYH